MSKPQTRSNSINVASPTPGPVEMNAEEEVKSGDNPGNLGLPTIQPSNSLSLQMSQHSANNQIQMSAEQQNWFEKQTDKEKRRPTLKNGIVSSWRTFLADYLIYKAEENGIQSMVELISQKAKQGLMITLQMDSQTFLKQTDEQCIDALNKHFKLEQISNYRSILNKCKMKFVRNSAINTDNIQLYVEDFVDQMYKNPHFTNEKLRGAPPKVINAIFINGFTPPLFRDIVKDLGTTDYETTIRMLPDIYSELEIYLRWKIKDEKTDSEQQNDSDTENSNKPRVKEYNGKLKSCTYCHINYPSLANSHNDEKCYFLHPERRDQSHKDYLEREREREIAKGQRSA